MKRKPEVADFIGLRKVAGETPCFLITGRNGKTKVTPVEDILEDGTPIEGVSVQHSMFGGRDTIFVRTRLTGPGGQSLWVQASHVASEGT
jgi:hypothetical protein